MVQVESLRYGGYVFTLEEMLRTVAERAAEARRVASLGAAALDELGLHDALEFDMGRTLAVMDYYHLTYLPSLARRP